MHDINANLRIDTYHPPFGEISDSQLKEAYDELQVTQPSVVWVGISTPRQEHLAARLAKLWPNVPIVAIGAGFDFVAGMKPEAPRIMTVLCLEWLYRLHSEPSRLFKRYAHTVPRFLYCFVEDAFRPRPRERLAEKKSLDI